jgi:hypothetical protein
MPGLAEVAEARLRNCNQCAKDVGSCSPVCRNCGHLQATPPAKRPLVGLLFTMNGARHGRILHVERASVSVLARASRAAEF